MCGAFGNGAFFTCNCLSDRDHEIWSECWLLVPSGCWCTNCGTEPTMMSSLSLVSGQTRRTMNCNPEHSRLGMPLLNTGL
jgi:hypothetical protein